MLVGMLYTSKAVLRSTVASLPMDPALAAAVQALAVPGGNAVVQTPVYNHFFNCVKDSGAKVVENPLIYENGAYSPDFAASSNTASSPSI